MNVCENFSKYIPYINKYKYCFKLFAKLNGEIDVNPKGVGGTTEFVFQF